MARTHRSGGAGRTITVGWSTHEPDEPAHLAAFGHESAGGESSPTSTPMRRGPRRPLLLAAITLVLALILALPALLLGGGSAEQTATRFLQAVIDGDAEVVREHLTPSEGALDIALTDEVLAAAPERLERFTIEQVSIEGDRAEVIAALTRDGNTLETTLHLERHREGLLRRPAWELQPVTLPVLRLEIPVGSEQLVIDGQVVEIPAEHRPEEAFGLSPILLHVLPGMFEISAQEIGDHLAPAPRRVNAPPVLGSWVSPPAPIGYELTETGVEQLAADLEGSLEECLSSTSPRPEGCPFVAPYEVTDSGAWELTDPLEVVNAGGDASIFSVRMTGAATFTVDGEDGTAPQVHEAQIDASAAAMLDRDGVLTPQSRPWSMGAVSLECPEGASATYSWSSEGSVGECIPDE